MEAWSYSVDESRVFLLLSHLVIGPSIEQRRSHTVGGRVPMTRGGPLRRVSPPVSPSLDSG